MSRSVRVAILGNAGKQVCSGGARWMVRLLKDEVPAGRKTASNLHENAERDSGFRLSRYRFVSTQPS